MLVRSPARLPLRSVVVGRVAGRGTPSEGRRGAERGGQIESGVA
jgi:hypothetical protein